MVSVREVQLAPGLLVSMPQLHDPHFERSVVLMVEHNDEGSFGLILNHPSELPVTQLLEALDLEWHGDPDQTVWSGGPVMPTSGWVLHEPFDALTASRSDLESALESGSTVAVGEGLCLSTSTISLQALADSPPPRTKFLLGYAGWGPGQLAFEMARGSWLHADVDSDLVFDAPADDIWKLALQSIGVDPEAIIQTRGVH